MKNATKILAKEVRRVRALVKVREEFGVPSLRFQVELNALRRVLAMLIRSSYEKEIDKG